MPRPIQLRPRAAPDPGTRVLIDVEAPGTVPSTDAQSLDVYCGQCGALMASGVPAKVAKIAVFRCKLCRSFNDPSETVAE